MDRLLFAAEAEVVRYRSSESLSPHPKIRLLTDNDVRIPSFPKDGSVN